MFVCTVTRVDNVCIDPVIVDHGVRRTRVVVAKHDEVRAHAHQAIPLPVIDVFALGLFRRHAHGDAAHQLHFFDLHIAVAEAHNLMARDVGLRNDALDQQLLREALQIILRAEHATVEVFRHAQQARLFHHIRVIRTRCQVQLQPLFLGARDRDLVARVGVADHRASDGLDQLSVQCWRHATPGV